MEDQLLAVKCVGIEAAMLNASSSREEVSRVHSAMTDAKKGASLRLLYVTPEKLSKSKRFMSKLEKMYEMGRLSRIVIDEVHCASQWGHDFRPDYKILGVLKRQFPKTPILGLTATATSKVLADCQDILSLKSCLTFRASYNRPNLFYEVRYKPSSLKAQVEEIAGLIKTKFTKQSGQYIILTNTHVHVCICNTVPHTVSCDSHLMSTIWIRIMVYTSTNITPLSHTLAAFVCIRGQILMYIHVLAYIVFTSDVHT